MVKPRRACRSASKSCDYTMTGNRFGRSTKALRYLPSASPGPKNSKPVHSELLGLESLQSDANLPVIQGLLQCIQYKVGSHRTADAPAG